MEAGGSGGVSFLFFIPRDWEGVGGCGHHQSLESKNIELFSFGISKKCFSNNRNEGISVYKLHGEQLMHFRRTASAPILPPLLQAPFQVGLAHPVLICFSFEVKKKKRIHRSDNKPNIQARRKGKKAKSASAMSPL